MSRGRKPPQTISPQGSPQDCFALQSYEGTYFATNRRWYIDLFDFSQIEPGKPIPTIQLRHAGAYAIGYLPSSELVVTVSPSEVKTWRMETKTEAKEIDSFKNDESHIAVKMLEEEAESVMENEPAKMLKLCVLPDEEKAFYLADGGRVRTIDLKNKQFTRPPLYSTPEGAHQIELLGTNYLALVTKNEIHIYDITKKNFFNEPALYVAETPGIIHLAVWPGGNILGIFQQEQPKAGDTDKKKDKSELPIHLTICAFTAGEPLKILTEVSDDIQIFDRSRRNWSYKPAIVGEILYYFNKTQKSKSLKEPELEIKGINPFTGITHFFTKQTDQDVFYNLSDLHNLLSTCKGLSVLNGLSKLQIFPSSAPKEKERLIPPEKIRDVVISAGITRDPANIVASYTLSPGFFSPTIMSPLRMPLTEEKFQWLVLEFSQLANEKKLKKYHKDLQQLLLFVTSVEYRQQSYSTSINMLKSLKKLYNIGTNNPLLATKFSAEEQRLFNFLQIMVGLNETKKIEFKRKGAG